MYGTSKAKPFGSRSSDLIGRIRRQLRALENYDNSLKLTLITLAICVMDGLSFYVSMEALIRTEGALFQKILFSAALSVCFDMTPSRIADILFIPKENGMTKKDKMTLSVLLISFALGVIIYGVMKLSKDSLTAYFALDPEDGDTITTAMYALAAFQTFMPIATSAFLFGTRYREIIQTPERLKQFAEDHIVLLNARYDEISAEKTELMIDQECPRDELFAKDIDAVNHLTDQYIELTKIEYAHMLAQKVNTPDMYTKAEEHFEEAYN